MALFVNDGEAADLFGQEDAEVTGRGYDGVGSFLSRFEK